jgi:hypothetical protein
MTTYQGQLAKGSEWAYLSTPRAFPIRVKVLRLGTKTPIRHLVCFLGDEWEGHEERVIPSRLRYPWSEVEARLADQAALTALLAYGDPTIGEDLAADYITDTFLGLMVRRQTRSGRLGLLDVLDAEATAQTNGLPLDDVRRDGHEFDGVLTVPWATATAIFAATARANAGTVLSHVRAEEKQGLREASFGKRFGKGKTASYRRPDACEESFEELMRPTLDVLAAWVGQNAASVKQRYQEALALSRLAYDIADTALLALRRADRKPEALRLYRLLHPEAAGDEWVTNRELKTASEIERLRRTVEGFEARPGDQWGSPQLS